MVRVISTSKGRSQPMALSPLLPSNATHRAGLRVSALTEEMITATEMVTENCWYNLPVIPGMNATGTNTASNTSVVAITGPVTSAIALVTASRIGSFSSTRIRSTFSITTIASSTTMPIARTSPNSVMVLME